MADTVAPPLHNRYGAESHPLDRGIFTLSLDFELIWGTLDLTGPTGFARACAVERGEVIDRLLALFEEFEIPATWLVLGHIMLDACSPKDGVKHPEIVRPRHPWHTQDWFADDPCGNEQSHPNFYGASLVRQIRACRVQQEIGCHTFSHPIFGDPGCSRATAYSELAACRQVAEPTGLELRSFAFPRNRPGHLDVLQEHGFTCFRGPEPNWYVRPRIPSAARRVAHLIDVALARRPPLGDPHLVGALWNVPGSMIFFPANGVRRFIPARQRVKRALKGLDGAARERKLFHLWFHPTNLVDHLDGMLTGLRTVLSRAAEYRERGQLSIAPIGSVPSLVGGRSPDGLSRQ